MNLFMRFGAVANISGGESSPEINGTVRFYRMGDGTVIAAEIKGLPKEGSFFGFHIHEGADCGGDSFGNTGSHYNPSGAIHPLHAGDLPPLLNVGGEAFLAFKTDRFTVDEIIGRTVVIHSNPDDFISQPAGGAGEKIACGVIIRH